MGKLKLPTKRWLSFLYPKMRSKKQPPMKKKGVENPKTALRKRVPVSSLKYRDTPAMRIMKPIANEIMARKRKLILSLIFEPLICPLVLMEIWFLFLSIFLVHSASLFPNTKPKTD